jgi:hypothetical protein
MRYKLLLLSLSFILISSFALEMKPQEVPANHKNFFQKNFNKFMGQLHAVLDRGKGFKAPFSRGKGYWSSPNEEANTGFFNRLAEPESQREDWYSVTPCISEFWCAISNMGLISVGLKYQSPEVICAGLASFAYHSYPKQWLLYVDRIGVAFALLKFAREYQVLKENPHLLVLPVAVGAINLLDVYLGQYKGKTWPHVAWHLSAAAMAAYFLSHLKN